MAYGDKTIAIPPSLLISALAIVPDVTRSVTMDFKKAGNAIWLVGETRDELMDVFADLRSVGCDMLTLGQYLQPTPEHLPVERFVPPEEFDEIGELARKLGFGMVASGPFVRSSYHAGEMAEQLS